MKIFCDTSALTKLYIREKESDVVVGYFEKSDEILVSVLCLPEIFSVLNRLKRERALSTPQYAELKKTILGHFEDFRICEITDEVIQTVCQLLESHPLKAADAVHLACAFHVRP
ncbi:MAG: VapC toxin family PIN domain ribonuclease, partial [Candidatus Omnitrophica bacterium CG12_big_fil_rev_8_21_14_0_65_50_5]